MHSRQYSRPLTVSSAPAFEGSDLFSASAGLEPSFAKPGLAARTTPERKARATQKTMEIKTRCLIFDLTFPGRSGSGLFLAVTVVADLVEAEFVLFVGNDLFAGVPDGDDALDGQILRKTEEPGDKLR